MAKPNRYPWFKFYGEFRYDIKVKRMPMLDRYRLIMLLCLANENGERGLITGLDDEDLAFELELETEDWLTLKSKFRVKGFIELVDGGIKIKNWEKRQYGYESDKPENTRARKRKSRKKLSAKAKQDKASSQKDVTSVTSESRVVTGSHDTEKDTEYLSIHAEKTKQDQDLDQQKNTESAPEKQDQNNPTSPSKFLSGAKQTARVNVQDPFELNMQRRLFWKQCPWRSGAGINQVDVEFLQFLSSGPFKSLGKDVSEVKVWLVNLEKEFKKNLDISILDKPMIRWEKYQSTVQSISEGGQTEKIYQATALSHLTREQIDEALANGCGQVMDIYNYHEKIGAVA